MKFMNTDIFADSTNLSEATVVTLYLLPSLNVKLLPKLRRELKPGTRIVSNSFSMGDWEAERRSKWTAGPSISGQYRRRRATLAGRVA